MNETESKYVTQPHILPVLPDSGSALQLHGASGGGSEPNVLRDACIMMVDDEPINIEVIQEFLTEAGYSNFIDTSEPTLAMDLMVEHKPDVVLLDLMMPEVTGFDILQFMRMDERYRHIPVIVLTSSSSPEAKLRALELGATDFLNKPVDPSELALRIRNTLVAKVYLDRLAYCDLLTGLPNRRMFYDHLDWALRQAHRHGRSGALMYINVDRFKKINDALGPTFGDVFLQEVSQRLEKSIRSTDSVSRTEAGHPYLSRVGGDEFAVLLTEIEKEEDAIHVARRLLNVMKEPFHIASQGLFTSCSVGITVFPGDGTERDLLLQNAGVAMNFAKQQGGNAYQFYSSDLNERSLQYLGLQSDLHKAIGLGEMKLFYQPKVDTQTRRIVGAEALIRWQHGERGFIRPDEFIPLAEESGLIVPIGAWVLAEACRHIRSWQMRGLAVPRISVNVSGHQFSSPDFLESVREIMASSGVDPTYFTFEVTESVLMKNADDSIALLNQFKSMGLHLSMDDFGTGYSSLSYLRGFPLDELKIDRSFLQELEQLEQLEEPERLRSAKGRGTLIAGIIALGRSLGLRVVVEGVETEQQYRFLKEKGCDQCQGFLFAKPMPCVEFEQLL